MKQVFRVTIHYVGNTTNEISVIAKDDVTARSAAIKKDAKGYDGINAKQPPIKFCEVRHITTAVQA